MSTIQNANVGIFRLQCRLGNDAMPAPQLTPYIQRRTKHGNDTTATQHKPLQPTATTRSTIEPTVGSDEVQQPSEQLDAQNACAKLPRIADHFQNQIPFSRPTAQGVLDPKLVAS